MAGKFRIFCDPTTNEPEGKPMVLGNQPQPPQLQAHQPTSQATSGSSSSSNNNNHHHHSQETQQQAAKLAAVIAAVSGANNNNNNNKREPLGLRQTSSQQQLHATSTTGTTTVGLQESASSLTSSSSSSSSAVLSANDTEDQENDISMASLGSDFVPSILHDDDDDQFEDHSFEVEEEEEGISCADESVGDYDGALSCDVYDEEEDLLEDEELRMELSQAFKQHDDSQLFKSTIYIDEIESYLHQLERKPELRPLPNYMKYQGDIDTDKRAILINWLVEVSDEYDLETETLFICISIIDRFLSKMSIPTCNFQLLGVAAMFIASKWEEIYPPNLYQFIEVTDDTYSGQQILQMEQEILKTLNFRLSYPTISFFLRQIFAFNKFTKKVYHLAEYLCYLSLLSDEPFLEYYPSEIALAAVILAAHQLDASANISSELKAAYDESNLDQLRRRNLPKGMETEQADRRVYIVNQELPFCIEALRALQQRAHSRSSRLSTDSAIYNKFASSSHSSVSHLPAPKVEELFNY